MHSNIQYYLNLLKLLFDIILQMIPIITSNNNNAKLIQVGESTHTQDQFITPTNFNTTNIIVRTVDIPTPPLVFLFSIFFALTFCHLFYEIVNVLVTNHPFAPKSIYSYKFSFIRQSLRKVFYCFGFGSVKLST